MRRLFGHALIGTLVFALVASAAAWRQCAALQSAAAATTATVAHGADAPNHHASDQDQHDHHATHHPEAADDPVLPAADDHGCMTCCTMCVAANAILPAANTSVTFTVSAQIFFPGHKAWSATTLAVDPGIPKRIA
jgi:hypothetical protein